MKQVESWQIFTVAVTILATAIALIIAFHDSLPNWLFLCLTIPLGMALAGCLTWLIVITKPLQYFSTYIKKTSKNRSERKHREQQLQMRAGIIEEWQQKWLELGDLIIEVIECETEPTSTQEEQYRDLHRWFVEKRSEVLPIWQHFIQVRTPMANEHYDKGSFADFVLKRKWDDPFSYFYQPFSIQRLAMQLKVIPAGDRWVPSEDVVSQIRFVVLILSDLVIEFVTWSKKYK